MQIVTARTAEDYAEARRLIDAYAHSLGIDLEYQHYADEFANIETMYGPPGGCLLLARRDGDAVGCVALRKLDDVTCEMKRLYVVPTERGSGAGRLLAEAVIAAAQGLGYRSMRLDTLVTMTAAQSLYRVLGFEETAPYYETPYPTVFMERKL